MTFTIRCLRGIDRLWDETFIREQDASAYYLHKAKLAQQYGPTAAAFRFEFWQGETLIDSFETTEVES